MFESYVSATYKDFELLLEVGKRKVALQSNVSLVTYRSVGKL